jgi:XisH protein
MASPVRRPDNPIASLGRSINDGVAVSAKNIYHACVVQALVTDGWTITDDPLKLEYGDQRLYVDLGAERGPLGAEKEGRKIAVEIQSFLGRSAVRDLEEAIGQYEIYRMMLALSEPDRSLYMAAPVRVYQTLLTKEFGQLVVSNLGLRLLIFDDHKERIHLWIEPSDTGRS